MLYLCSSQKVLLFLLCLLAIHVMATSANDNVVVVDELTNPTALANEICANSRQTCVNLLLPLIQLEMFSLFNIKLGGWTHNEACGCLLPPQTKLPHIQYFHIPKSGTSINWFLRDYFDGCGDAEELGSQDPCPIWLETETQQAAGLCDGRLFSCMGHSVNPDLPHIVLNKITNVVTFLREPFARLQSDFHYISTHPATGHLGPGVNISQLLSFVEDTAPADNKMLRFMTYPGISNCATKMLNGHQCGDVVVLDDSHLEVAIRVLDNFLYYGITEFFHESICLLAFTYGGEPLPQHFRKYRAGNYKSKRMEEVFNEAEIDKFLISEMYDLKLYEYALANFLHNFDLTRCPRRS